MSETRNITLGTSGGTPIVANVLTLGSDVDVLVHLSADYTLVNPRPPGFPFRPTMTGSNFANLDTPGRVLASGSTIGFLACEANALVAASAGTLA